MTKLLKQAGQEIVEPIQEVANGTGESEIEPTFYNRLNRVRVSGTTPEHSLHRHSLTSELCSGLFHDEFHLRDQIEISSKL